VAADVTSAVAEGSPCLELPLWLRFASESLGEDMHRDGMAGGNGEKRYSLAVVECFNLQ
jgi:hypothetical protein